MQISYWIINQTWTNSVMQLQKKVPSQATTTEGIVLGSRGVILSLYGQIATMMTSYLRKNADKLEHVQRRATKRNNGTGGMGMFNLKKRSKYIMIHFYLFPNNSNSDIGGIIQQMILWHLNCLASDHTTSIAYPGNVFFMAISG